MWKFIKALIVESLTLSKSYMIVTYCYSYIAGRVSERSRLILAFILAQLTANTSNKPFSALGFTADRID